MSNVPQGRPVQVEGTLVESVAVGAYWHMTLLAPGVADTARPGHFVALSIGGSETSMLLRRSFSLHRATVTDGTIEVIVADAGPGTHWISTRRAHDTIGVVGPVGQPFPIPAEPVSCTLVGGGYGSAPLFWLAEVLRDKGCSVEVVLGAATEQRLFDAPAAAGVPASIITTDDGSLGVHGRVTDVLPEVLAGSGASVVYACGPMAMLQAVTDVATAHGAVAHVAVEESMACGIGICMTCVLPVVGEDGRTRMVRSCVEGPVFRGDRVRWDAFSGGLGLVPEDAVGAPRVGPTIPVAAAPARSDGSSVGGGT